MRQLWILGLAMVFSPAESRAEETDVVAVVTEGEGLTSGIRDEKALPGDAAETGQFPYQVLVHTSLLHPVTMLEIRRMCSGAIIGDVNVITAAHCVYQKGFQFANSSRVTAGILTKLDENTADQSRTFSQQQVCIHPQYEITRRPPRIYHDLALITLEQPFEWNNLIGLTAISETRPEPGTGCLVAGWGHANANDPVGEDALRFSTLTSLDQDDCSSLVSSHICVMPAGERASSCVADSGSPLVCDGRLVGVASFTAEMCALTNEAHFTDVVSNKEWFSDENRPCYYGDQTA